MLQLNSMEEFYKSLKDIEIINSGLDIKRSQLKGYIDEFHNVIQTRGINKDIIQQNENMSNVLNETIAYIKDSTNIWIKNFDEMLLKEKFRSDLANYFIIIIFGKVKAGKSSLGNFVAKHKLDTQIVKFFKYDEAGQKESIKKLEEIDDIQFATNNLECTIEIQGFTLDGLAWIDTPGIGSMVKENGELAKAYIQSADYIIYPTSSDSPLQQDETKQLKELFEQNKKVTICITKSDEKEEDEVDGKMVQVLQNKSSKKRDSQEKYVKDEIIKILQTDKESVLGDIFSISTHTASSGLEDKNDILFENSNIPKFYELITKVVKEKSTKLKEDTPIDGFMSFVDNNLLGASSVLQKNSILAIKEKLNVLEATIQESLERFDTLKENIDNDLESKIESVLTEYYSQINIDNSKNIFSTINTQIHTEIVETIENTIGEIINNFKITLISSTAYYNESDFEINEKFEEQKNSTAERNKEIGASLGRLVASLGIFCTPFTGGLSFVASTAVLLTATTVAGFIGGKAGEITGSEEISKIRIGDTKEEAIQRFKMNSLKYYSSFVTYLYTQLQRDFFNQLKIISKEINGDIVEFEQKIKKLRG